MRKSAPCLSQTKKNMLKKILGDSKGLEIKKKCRNKKQYKTNTEAKLELFLKRSKNIHYDQFEEKFLY